MRCASLFVNPCPGPDALEDYYSNCLCNALNRKLWEKRKKKKSSAYILDERIRVLEQLFKKITQKPVRILEVGSGSGTFLERIRTLFPGQDMELLGVDLDRNAAALARDKGLNVVHGNIESMISDKRKRFQIIMHFELIEHLVHPIEFLSHCFKLLDRDGFLLFTTPNGDGLDNMSIGYNYPDRMMAHSLYPPMHLNSYNTKNIYHLLLSQGYKIVQISTPGRLDVDIISVHDSPLIDPIYRWVVPLPEEIRSAVQDLISRLNASAHMLVVAQK